MTDLTPKIDALRTRVSLLAQNGGRQLGLTRAEIAIAVTVAQQTLDDQKDQLDNLVEEARNQAATSGQDVQPCTDAADTAVNELDVNSLSTCRQSLVLDLVGIQLGQLTGLKRQLSRLSLLCRKTNPLNPEGANACIEEGLSTIEQNADRIQGEIDAICVKAADEARACADRTLESLVLGIDVVAHDLKTCLENVL